VAPGTGVWRVATVVFVVVLVRRGGAKRGAVQLAGPYGR
jgi:hypothetical protein